MITDFKIFEENNKETTFIINDLIDYFKNNEEYYQNIYPERRYNFEDAISYFLQELLLNTMVKINCIECTSNDNGVKSYRHRNKTHKGIVSGYGYGMLENGDDEHIHLDLYLRRIRHNHLVDVNTPIIIFGDIDKELSDIIDDVNMISNSKKYNL